MKYIHVKSLSGISALTLAISVIIPPVVLLFIALTLTALYGVSKRRGVDKLLMYKWVILYAYFLLIIVWLISLGDGAGLVMAFGGYMLVVGTFVPLGAYCLTELFRYNAMDQKVNTKK